MGWRYILLDYRLERVCSVDLKMNFLDEGMAVFENLAKTFSKFV